MRILLNGSRSFIARAVAEACTCVGVEYLPLTHDQDLRKALRAGDCLINFAIDPRYRIGPYVASQDWDARAAGAAAAVGAHFIMLSSRRVYSEAQRWNACEQSPVNGDETAYGRNKAITEKAVRQICGGQAGIFRLANTFGYEYSPQPRHSFLGQMLHSLKQQNKIFFDMQSATRRDFLPVETCAALLTSRAMESCVGTYNLGSGFAVSCGDLAGWVMEGFGGGELLCDPLIVRDEFCLNMDNWRARFSLPVNPGLIRDYCIGLGRRLKCEKY
jgi:UDP-glucose 4-epimerase